MAFKMKAGKEGPMKKNFPGAFKKDKLTELAKQGQPKGTKEALDTANKISSDTGERGYSKKRRKKNVYNQMMGQFDKVVPSRAVRAVDKIQKGVSGAHGAITTGLKNMLGKKTKLYKGTPNK
tara:strand:- start:900 stop:1265 length:366 start_codon:yes stop_codon:yes gene_type:complete